ncbi:MAG: MBL fold metallo-hydrolase [Verrucomicrobia bacterium]|nr:MBL fold metallo-hydrolase [Verrucomicrobiota bacterium]
MKILTFPSGPYRTNCYVVVSMPTKEAAIIDPSPGSFARVEKVIEEQGLTPTQLILTHSHWDHIADASHFVQKWHLPVLIHPEDAKNLIQPGSDHIPYSVPIQGVLPSKLLNEGDSIMIGESKWTVLHTPGHSPGCICLWCEEEKTVISGDTLFKGTFGNPQLPTGEPARMLPSLKRLSLLPGDTVVYPGHGEATTIAQEKWLEQAETLFGE